MGRDEINAFGEKLKAELLDGEQAVIVEIAACSETDECEVKSVKVTLGSSIVGKGYQTFTGHAVYLHDAVLLARRKMREAKAKRLKKDAD